MEIIKNIIEDISNIKRLKSRLATGKHKIIKMNDQQTNLITNSKAIIALIKK